MSKLHTRVIRHLALMAVAVAAGLMSFVVPSAAQMPMALVAAGALAWLTLVPFDGAPMLGWQAGASLAETLSAIAGDLKTVYGSTLVQVLPDAAILQREFPLSNSADFPLVGDYFSALIGLQFPWGFSFLGQGYEGTSTNTTLGDALAGQTKPAQIYPCTTVLADNLAYQILDRANQSNSEKAILSALSYTGKQMAIIMRNVLELQLLHGRQGIGNVTAISGAGPYVISIDAMSTSVGILSLLIGARLQFMVSDNTTARTANSTANNLTVTAITLDPANVTHTVTVTQTGATNVAAVVATDIMYIAGTRGVSVNNGDTNVPHYEQIGLGLQLNEMSASIFGITKANFVGWQANQMTSIGAFSPSILMTAAQKSMARGGELGEYLAILSTEGWAVLNSALATNEVYNQQSPDFSMSKKVGTEEITVKHGGIKITVLPHPLQKAGQFYLVPKNEVKRIGSVDLTFALPGRPDDEFIYPIPGTATIQRQCRADWQLVLLKPPSGVIGSGLTYS